MNKKPVLTYRALAEGNVIAVGDNVAEVTSGFDKVSRYIDNIKSITDSDIAEWNHTFIREAGQIYYTFDKTCDTPLEIIPGKHHVYIKRETEDGVSFAELYCPEDNDKIYDSYEAAEYALACIKLKELNGKIDDAYHEYANISCHLRSIKYKLQDYSELKERYKNIINKHK